MNVPPATIQCAIDNYDVDSFVPVAAHFGQDRFGYVVTPNADHLIRLHDDATFRIFYDDAAFVLLDSRFLSHLFRLTRGVVARVCTGSDLTARLFGGVIAPDDRIVVIGVEPDRIGMLAERFGLSDLRHFNPPMGFIGNPAAIEECLDFVERQSPFRFCFLAVGSPQQEMLARQLKLRGVARGLALCVGASINFMTGVERRAPLWMQRIGAEWLFRLLRDPGRLAQRYLVRGPRVFALMRQTDLVLRPPA